MDRKKLLRITSQEEENKVDFKEKMNQGSNENLLNEKMFDLYFHSKGIKLSEQNRKILPKKYPSDAILEAVKNAVLYRDYTLSNYIEVIIGNEEIVVKNPGRFIENSQNYAINYSKRNMWIYERLITLDKKNRFAGDGKGFKRMDEILRNLGSVRVVDSKEDMAVKVIFPGIKALKS